MTLGIVATTVLTSCQKQFEDILPSGSVLSLEQVSEGARASQEAAEAGVPGMYAMLTARELVYANQGDFGYPSYALILEHAGDNVVSSTHGYNWFSGPLQYIRFNSLQGPNSYKWWIFSYKNIKLANDLMQPIFDTKDPKLLPVLGQARAMRAWNYFNLARLYQKTYVGNESKPSVPIVSFDTPIEKIANNPRVTVQELYDFILEDLNAAVDALKGFKPSAKNMISEAVAYGIRSRVYLTMGKYKEAADDAQKAISISGATPYSIEDCSIPNFDDVQTSKNTLWGIIITEEDAVTKSGIANFTSMFTSLCFGSGGYTTLVGQFKKINTRLFKNIPDSDVRKGWWAYERLEAKDKDGKPVYGYTSPLLKKAYPNLARNIAFKLHPLSVLKFAPNKKNPLEPVNAVDYMLMRVEEMYYILAEATAMSGNFAAGKKILEDFEKTYRNPEFASAATDAKSLQDEIYTIKRYEFYGEGISWFDMIRLGKGLNRIDISTKDDGGYPPLAKFNIAADADNFVFMIPESEEQANAALKDNNNPLAIDPKDQI